MKGLQQPGETMERMCIMCWMLAAALVWAGSVSLSGAATPVIVHTAAWPGQQFILTVGGPHGWNTPPNITFFNEWAQRRMFNAAVGNVLVFRSDPGSNSSVVVFTTSDESRTPSSICQDKSIVTSHGTNHFTTGVSLVLLKSGITYWFLSAFPGDCEAGLAFHVTVKEKENVAYDYSPLRRDVGVAYIMDYNDTSGSRVNTFGSFIQPQPAVFDNSSATSARYFTGDALNIAFYGSNRLFINSNSGARASCTINQEQFVFGPSGIDLLFVSVFLGGNESSQFRNYYSLALSPTANCHQGITLADFAIRNTTSPETCGRKPGAPYICSGALKVATFSTGVIVLLASLILLLVGSVG